MLLTQQNPGTRVEVENPTAWVTRAAVMSTTDREIKQQVVIADSSEGCKSKIKV